MVLNENLGENLESNRKIEKLISHLLSKGDIKDRKEVTPQRVIMLLGLTEYAIEEKIKQYQIESANPLDIINGIEQEYLVKDIIPMNILNKYIGKRKPIYDNLNESLSALLKLNNHDALQGLMEEIQTEAIINWKKAFIECIHSYVIFLNENLKNIGEKAEKSFVLEVKEKKYKELMDLYEEKEEKQSIFEKGSRIVLNRQKKINQIEGKITLLNQKKTNLAKEIERLRQSPISYLINEIVKEIEVIERKMNTDLEVINSLRIINKGKSFEKQETEIKDSYGMLLKFLSSLKQFVENKDNIENVDQKYSELHALYGGLEDISNSEEFDKIGRFFESIKIKGHHVKITYEDDTVDEISKKQQAIKDTDEEIGTLKDEENELEKQNKGRGKRKKEKYDELEDVLLNSSSKAKKEQASENFTEKDIIELHKDLIRIDKKIDKLKSELLEGLESVADIETRSKIIDFFGINIEEIASLFETDETDVIKKGSGKGKTIDVFDRDNRIGVFIKTLLENNILSIPDLQDSSKISITQETSNSPYYYICIYGNINKIFCINNDYGNATFVYYGTDFNELKEMFTSKKSIKEEFKKNGAGTYFRYLDTQRWRKKIKEELGLSDDGGDDGGDDGLEEGNETSTKKIDKDLNVGSKEEIREYFRNIKSFKIDSEIDYLKFVNEHNDDFNTKTGHNLPSEFKGIFIILGGDYYKCKDTKYLLELLKSDEAGQQYLEGKESGMFFTRQDVAIVNELKKFINDNESINIIARGNTSGIKTIGKQFDGYLKAKGIETNGKSLRLSKKYIISLLGGEIWISDAKFCEKYIKSLIDPQGDPNKVIQEYCNSHEGQEKIKRYKAVLGCIVDYFCNNEDKRFPSTQDEYGKFVVAHEDYFKAYVNSKNMTSYFEKYKHTFPSRTCIYEIMFKLLGIDESVEIAMSRMINERLSKTAK